MKRIVSLLVCAVMLLSMCSVACVSVGAVEIEGDWTTYRLATDYHEPDPETGEEPAYRPAPGYEYTDEGFSTIPADYTGTSPYMTVQTKEKFDIKEGLYLQFRVDEFSYQGPEGNADEWITVSLWDSQNLAPGNVHYGAGWLTLMRGAGQGATVDGASCFTTKTVDGVPGSWGDLGNYDFEPEVDDEGREIYTMEVEWTGSAYEVFMCGVKLNSCEGITEKLESVDETGEFYVGISMHSSVKDGRASITILKFGTSEADATKPVGSDTKEPEPNINITAPMMDPSTIEKNKPAVYIDATTNTAASLSYAGGQVFVQGDNSFHFVAEASTSTIDWTIRKNISYAVEDFPIVAMMVRDFWYDGGIWYHCGDIVNATAGYHTGFDIYSGASFDGVEYADYSLILVDLSYLCTGRINGFRIHFDHVDMSNPEFDLCYMGCFRSEDEAIAYGYEFLGIDIPADTEAPVTEPPAAQDTEAPAEGTQAPTEGTQSPTVGTQTPADGTETDAPVEGGCKSVIGMSAVAVLVVAVAFVALKKKD